MICCTLVYASVVVQALMLKLGSLLSCATRWYTLLCAVYALLRRAALLSTLICNTLQRAVPTLLCLTKSHGVLL